MRSLQFPRLNRTLRVRVTLFMAFAVLLAGFAQASHFHKDELGSRGDTHLQCLLCLHSASSATPPTLPTLTAPAAAHSGVLPNIAVLPVVERRAANYDARGPPRV